MRTVIGRSLPLFGLALLALAGCTTEVASSPRSSADFPLFGSNDGHAALSITVVDERRRVQDFVDIDDADRVRFALSALGTPAAFAGERVTTQTLAATGSPTTFTSLYNNLRPGNVQLKADVYKNADGAGSFSPSIVRGEGIATASLTAGVTSTITVKINAVGNISFSNSNFQNYVADYKVVTGDTVWIDTAMNTVNNPLVKRITAVYRPGSNASGTAVWTGTPVTNSSSNATFSFAVPAPQSGDSELGTLYITGWDAVDPLVANQVAYKTKVVTIWKPAGVGSLIN